MPHSYSNMLEINLFYPSDKNKTKQNTDSTYHNMNMSVFLLHVLLELEDI